MDELVDSGIRDEAERVRDSLDPRGARAGYSSTSSASMSANRSW